MKMRPFLFTALFIIATCGCSTTYAPAPGIPDVKQIPNLPPGTRVALVNAQPSNEILLLGKNGPSTYYANLHVWTDRLILSLNNSLKKKKVLVDEHAPKVLKLSVDKAAVKSKAGGWAFQCDLNWTVQMSDGTTVPFYLEEGHWKVEDCSNVAVRRACLITLTNERVQRFINQP
jgi:hypothetical protein